MNCYISRNYKGISSAGNKAKTDIECIMSQMGFKNIGCHQTISKNYIYSFIITLFSVIKAIICVRKGDNVVIQYPFKKYFIFLCNMIHLRGGRIIVVIHDLGSFRRKRLSSEQEIRRLSHADYIIAHNDNMKKWLVDNGLELPVGTLGIFDYLSDEKAVNRKSNPNDYSIVYAGALSIKKNSFLYKLSDYINFYKLVLYGNGFDINKTKNSENINYEGFVESDNLIKSVKGDFGLVWDGDSLDKCSGNFGEYLKINNPHKVSLYIRCNLPIIIWEEAALSSFVSKNKIGLCIGSLKELGPIIKNLDVSEYEEMKQNIIKVSNSLLEGKYMKEALNNAIIALKKSYYDK